MTTKLWLSFLTLTSVVATTQTAQSQTYTPTNRTPVGDSTLGTQVSPTGNNFDITGGLRKGQTLFHSFTDFSVPENRAANFLNPVGNRDIITRVTGGLFSDINGIVNTNGANFFLINPSGIVFGPSATLNVGKAFVGSTANSIDLVGGGNTIKFGANPNGDALLSVAPDVLFDVSRLNLGGGTGAISNFGTLQTTNLNQYIGLIGGNVNMNGGQINAPGGRVDLGGLSAFGNVALGTDVNNLRAQFPTNVPRGDVSLINGARINVTRAGGGNVAINARNVEILGGSVIKGGIETGLGTPEALAGDIKLNATENIRVSGSNPLSNSTILEKSQITSNSAGQGDAGKITIETQGKLSLVNGGFISNNIDVLGGGNSQGINIKARELEIARDSYISTDTFQIIPVESKGNAGNIDIETTGDINLSGFISSNSRGEGDAGKISINANQGKLYLSSLGSISSAVSLTSVGNSQGIKITARELELTNGSSIFTNTFQLKQVKGKGNAGDIQIDTTGNMTISKSVISSTSDGAGDAGKIKIDTKKGKLLLVDQGLISSAITSPTAIVNGRGIKIDTGELELRNGSSIQTTTTDNTQGNAGNINISTTGDIRISGYNPELTNSTAQNVSGINSSSFGKGDVGDISIEAKGSLFLVNQGGVFSAGNAVTGGNVKLTINDKILLRNFSSISTDSAGNSKKSSGGNITIDSPLIVATRGDNNITANAYAGNGGKVNINSQGLFGIQFRAKGQDSPTTNDITASSRLGRDGAVNIDTPGTDPGKDSTELPNVTTDASNQISQVCSASNRQNKLTVTGRGGLPPNANDPLTSDVVWQDARAASGQPVASSATTNLPILIPPAVGWVFDGKGQVTLVAAVTQGQPTSTTAICPSKF